MLLGRFIKKLSRKFYCRVKPEKEKVEKTRRRKEKKTKKGVVAKRYRDWLQGAALAAMKKPVDRVFEMNRFKKRFTGITPTPCFFQRVTSFEKGKELREE